MLTHRPLVATLSLIIACTVIINTAHSAFAYPLQGHNGAVAKVVTPPRPYRNTWWSTWGSPAPQPPKNQSTLVVFVGVSDGRLIVDRTKSAGGFTVTDEFRSRLRPGMSAAEVEKTLSKFREILFDDLDQKFRSLDKVYRYALKDAETAKEPDDALTRELRSFPGRAGIGNWAEFSEKFDRWAGAEGVDRDLIRQVFSPSGMLQTLGSVKEQTALTFPTPKPPNLPFNAAQGRLTFKVTDPVGDLANESEYLIRFPNELDASKAAEKRGTMLKLLKSLKGQLWRGSQIKSRIEEYYAERGLGGVVKISPAGKEPREIVIPEAARIARLVFDKDISADEINKIVYLLLPDAQFRAFARTRPIKQIEVDVEGGEPLTFNRAVDLLELGMAPGTEPFFNQYAFQIQQLELSQLGFVADDVQTNSDVRVQTSGSYYVDINVFKAEEEEKGEKPANVPDPALPEANEDGLVRARRGGEAGSATDFVPSLTAASTGEPPATEDTAGDGTAADAASQPSLSPSPSPTTTPTPTPSPTPRSGETWQPKDKKNYVGFGVKYKTGQGIRLFGLAQRERLGLLSSQDALSVQAGAQDEALGALNYHSDFTLFDALNRRVAIQVTGKSDFNASRTFAGVKTDERRTGGLLRAELEIFRDLADSTLRFYAEGRRATVQLLQNDQTVSKQNLTTLDLGGLYLFEDRIAYKPKRLRLEPRLRLGLGLAQDEAQFASFLLNGNYHQQLSRTLEADITGRVELASRQTPLYELPALGGVEVLRGFREDDAIGRRLWSLQSELWTALPGTAGAESGFRKFLRRQVRLAGFLDVGGAYETTASTSGVRFGPGLGARIIYRPAIIKLDWAYGIGDAATTGRGRGRFYFSVGTNLPF
jgi:hypothetical protein